MPLSRAVLVAEAHRGFPSRGGGSAAIAARAQFARAVWSRTGERRLPGAAALDAALAALAPRALEWLCEFSPLGPLYLLPTRAWVNALARTLRGLRVRRVLEVAAGDGALSRALAAAAPDLTVVASDSGAWEAPAARMTRSEQRTHAAGTVAGLALGTEVLRLDARAAVRRVRPDLVLASWLPPGNLCDALITLPVRYVLEIGAGSGVTGSAFTWRFAHEFLEGPVESLMRCRLDGRGAAGSLKLEAGRAPVQARGKGTLRLHGRATLYYGKAHPDYHRETVRRGDWLWQFR